MKPNIWLILISTYAVGCAKPTPPSGAALPSGTDVAATVNGDPISMEEYCDHTGAKQTAQITTERGATTVRILGSFGLQSLQELVDQHVLLQMAKDEGVLPTEADVDKELKFQTELVPAYTGLLHDEGLTDSMIRHDLLVGLAREHLIMKGVTVQPSDVDGFLKAHPDKFADPAKATLEFIQIASPAKKALVDDALAGGASFGSVAARYSDAPGAAQTQGAYPLTVVSQMPKEFQNVVGATPEKHVSGWVPIGRGFFKFFVVAKAAAKPRTPTEAERELVRREIAMERGQVKNDFDHSFFARLSSAKVDVAVPYLKQTWARAWNQLSTPGGGVPSTR